MTPEEISGLLVLAGMMLMAFLCGVVAGMLWEAKSNRASEIPPPSPDPLLNDKFGPDYPFQKIQRRGK